jgi:hypothetical protein
MAVHLRISGVLVVLFCVGSIGAARADDSWACGNTIITLGATESDVLQNCGEPTSKSVEQEAKRQGRHYVGTTPIEHWTYASDTVTRVLTFDQGKLVSIKMQ